MAFPNDWYHLFVRITKDGQPAGGKCALSNPSVSWLRSKMRERAAAMVTLLDRRSAGLLPPERTDMDADQIAVEGGNLFVLFYVTACPLDDRDCQGECQQ